MIKKLLLIGALSILSISSFGQEIKKDAESVKTKMDVFASKTGNITKFTDTKLPDLKTSF